MQDPSSTLSRLGPEHPGGIKRLQVGCGPKNILSNWWNVDIRSFQGIDEALDVTQPWGFEGLEYVYGEHFLEHLSIEGAISFLRNAWTSLKVGGLIRLSTPALEWVLSTHFDLTETDSDQRILSTIAINRAFKGWGHQFLYSREFLEQLLKKLGYETIQFCEYGQSQHPALQNLERHGGYTVDKGYPSVWIVEATKGTVISEETTLDYIHFIGDSYSDHVRAGH